MKLRQHPKGWERAVYITTKRPVMYCTLVVYGKESRKKVCYDDIVCLGLLQDRKEDGLTLTDFPSPS